MNETISILDSCCSSTDNSLVWPDCFFFFCVWVGKKGSGNSSIEILCDRIARNWWVLTKRWPAGSSWKVYSLKGKETVWSLLQWPKAEVVRLSTVWGVIQTSTSAIQFDCLTREQLAIWGVIRKLSTSLLTSLFGSTQLVNASLTLTSSWRFCHTEFLWKGYQTLIFPTQTQKKKSGQATRDYTV